MLGDRASDEQLLQEPSQTRQELGVDQQRFLVQPLLENGDRSPLRRDTLEEDRWVDSQSSDEEVGGGVSPRWADAREEWLPREFRARSYSESFVMRDVNDRKHLRPLNWVSICFITYFNVCGGPWGSEQIISSAGPLPGLVGLLVMAALWALPMVMITAELSSAYPDDGGYSIWVAEAFGPFWGFQEAYWSWLSGVIDTAVYPVLAFDSAKQVISGNWNKPITGEDGVAGGGAAPDVVRFCNGSTDTPDVLPAASGFLTGAFLDGFEDSTAAGHWKRDYVIKLAMVLLFAGPNFFAVKSFGRVMTVLAMFVVLPFLVQVIYVLAVHKLDPTILAQVKEDATTEDWLQLISVLYWNLSGFDAVSTCAGEVRDPGNNYPRGLSMALVLVLTTYALPLAVFTMVNKPDWSCWDEGWFSVIGLEEAGRWMGLWIMVVSFAGNAGMYTAEVFEDSWQLCGMARTGLMPGVFGVRYKGDGAPLVAICFALGVICALIALDFNAIVVITNLFSCLSAMLEITAFLKLRMIEPHLERPFRLPIDHVGVVGLVMLVPLCLGSIIVLTSLFSSWLSVTINGVALIAGFALCHVMQRQGHIHYFYGRGSSETTHE